jgi:hypothetical protein
MGVFSREIRKEWRRFRNRLGKEEQRSNASMTDFAEKNILPSADIDGKKRFGADEPEAAEIAGFTADQLRSYEDSLKYYRDLKNSLDTARDEGKMEGKIEGKIEVAKMAIKKGMTNNDIADLTGLSVDEIQKLR